MPSSVRDPADAINAALVRIGFRQQIGDLRDGSEAANHALNIFGQTRDDMLRSSDWDFAQGTIEMELQKEAPAAGYFPPNTWNADDYPPLPWKFQYAYPGDCLKVRAVKPPPFFLPNFNPQPNRFSVINDASDDASIRAIACNVPPPGIVIYTRRVTNPALWAVDFTEALIDELGARLAPALTGMQPAQMQAVTGKVETEQAKMEQG